MGTAMLSLVRILRLIAQFVAIPILSRLLSPAEYGLVAIAMPFALFAMMLADAGIGMSLVRTPASERVVWSTCFWLSTLIGGVLGVLMMVSAPLAAHLFHEPQLAPMVMVLSFVVIAQAVHLIPVAALQQAQRFRSIACVEVFATALGLITAVYMAYHGFGAWALIAQQIAFFAVRVGLMCALSPFRPLLRFEWSLVREHVLFGRNVLGNGLINYFSRSFDNWVVGKALGATLLGFYSMAFQFARLPQLIIAGPLQYVMYSQLAKMKNHTPAIAQAFLLTTRLLAVIVIPLMAMAAVAHTPIFSFLLSEKWQEAGYVFMILAPACATQAVLAIGETVIYALGRTDIQLRTSAEYSVLWVLCLIAAVSVGLTAAAITFTACTLLYQLRYLSIVLPLLGIAKRDYFSSYLIPLIAAGLGIAAYQAVSHSATMEHWVYVVMAAVIGLAASLFSLLIQRHSLLDELRNWHVEPIIEDDHVEAGI